MGARARPDLRVGQCDHAVPLQVNLNFKYIPARATVPSGPGPGPGALAGGPAGDALRLTDTARLAARGH